MFSPTTQDWAAVAELIDAFEAARRCTKHIDMGEFIPIPSHPLHREVAAELIRVDLEYSWNDGNRKSLEDYRDVAPEVFKEPSLLAGAAFEEYRMRRLSGEKVAADEYADRFNIPVTDWPDFEPVSGHHCQNGLEKVAPHFPEPGEQFAGFSLIAVLGRGAFATVFLAQQADLARRPVALKVTNLRTLEPQHLARLQHTNIVPIYSLHEANGLLAVCMPYLGDRTLADVIAEYAGGKRLPKSGQAFLSTNAGLSDNTVIVDRSPTTTTREFNAGIGESTIDVEKSVARPFVDSVVELVAEIVAGLDHAHQRGIVHRDVKPANILVTSDGHPLLLDFNLSNEVVVNGKDSLTVGGTLPYMAPEHLQAVRAGGNLDARSDLFSLGVIMYELLTGRRPFSIREGAFDVSISEMIADRSAGPPSVRQYNNLVPPSIEAIVHKCLESKLDRRYASARELSEDLTRHLHNLPLIHAQNPSIIERISKWHRRHPRLMSAASLSAATLILLTFFAAMWIARGHYVARLEAKQKYQQFSGELNSARMQICLPDAEDALLTRGVEKAGTTLGMYGLLDADDLLVTAGYVNLASDERKKLNHDVVELSYFAARGETILAKHSNDDHSRKDHLKRAIKFNDIAHKCANSGGVPEVISQQHNEIQIQLGRPGESASVAARSAPLPIDGYFELQSFLEDREHAKAKPLLESLLSTRPTDPVVWLLLGNVYAALGRLTEAEGCYTSAASLQPDSYVAIYNRAICRTQQKHFTDALEDFERVLKLQPDLNCVLLNRAIAYESSGDFRRALTDLDSAIASGKVPPRAYFLRSRVRLKLNDVAGAEADRLEGLKLEPIDDVDWVAHGTARLRDDPNGALHDFQTALKFNPRSRLALQNIVHVTADRLNRRDEALGALNKWLEIEPSNSNALIGRAVLNGRLGARREALAGMDAALKSSQDPGILFQAACVLSLTATAENQDASRGLLLLSRAIELDPKLMSRAATDSDLRSLRDRPEYAAIIEPMQKLREVQSSLKNVTHTAVP